MKEIKAYILEQSESDTVNEEDVYLPSESHLKAQIADSKRVAELTEKLFESHLTFAEKQELKDLSQNIHHRAQATLKDLYPEYRPGNPVTEMEKLLEIEIDTSREI